MSILDRVGGAPISWGVCEAPDWGYELPADVVLDEMRGLGLRATELGPTGYLGREPADIRARLDRYGLRLIGGFLPVLMHVPSTLAEARAAIDTLAAAGAQLVVLAAQSGDSDGYDRAVPLSDVEWDALLSTVDELARLARAAGLTPALHPHAGTAVADRAAVLRLLDGSDVPLCLDTGHLLIGGTEPLELVERAAGRIAHVHLKDVRKAVLDSGAGYADAVRAGLYAPLGDGDLDIAGIVRALEESGYRGWYVLEQDTMLPGPPAPGGGPVHDVRRSLDFLRTKVAA